MSMAHCPSNEYDFEPIFKKRPKISAKYRQEIKIYL
jgi:hypothetical protein